MRLGDSWAVRQKGSSPLPCPSMSFLSSSPTLGRSGHLMSKLPLSIRYSASSGSSQIRLLLSPFPIAREYGLCAGASTPSSFRTVLRHDVNLDLVQAWGVRAQCALHCGRRPGLRAEGCAFVALSSKASSLRLGIGVDSARFEALMMLSTMRKSWVCGPWRANVFVCVRHGDRRESE